MKTNKNTIAFDLSKGEISIIGNFYGGSAAELRTLSENVNVALKSTTKKLSLKVDILGMDSTCFAILMQLMKTLVQADQAGLLKFEITWLVEENDEEMLDQIEITERILNHKIWTITYLSHSQIYIREVA